VDPYDSGWRESTDGHRIWHAQSANPQGVPVVFLHGGPGSSTNPDHRRFFDPAFYRIVLLDQRGCGRSTPRGEVRANTTSELVSDLERLRHELGIDRWLLFGGSWGSTLALAYAQAHPRAVSGLVLRGLFLASADELTWFLTGLSRFLPEAWSAFASGSEDQSSAGLLRHYHERVVLDDVAAAGRWNAWESAVMAVGEAPPAFPAADLATLARVRSSFITSSTAASRARPVVARLGAPLWLPALWCKAATIWVALSTAPLLRALA
jgi:proline iminopeptidase